MVLLRLLVLKLLVATVVAGKVMVQDKPVAMAVLVAAVEAALEVLMVQVELEVMQELALVSILMNLEKHHVVFFMLVAVLVEVVLIVVALAVAVTLVRPVELTLAVAVAVLIRMRLLVGLAAQVLLLFVIVEKLLEVYMQAQLY